MNIIDVYTHPKCIYSQAVKILFDRWGVAYREFDVSRDPIALRRIELLSHQKGVPVVDTGREVFVGFDRNALERTFREV